MYHERAQSREADMNRRTFLSGSAFGGATLLALGGRADAAEWTPLERTNV
jgi:hypothetical protein